MSSNRDVIQAGGDDTSGSDSGFDIGDTFSVDSTITQYRVENGRRYHAYKDGVYWAPNDEKQNEGLDIDHHKFLVLLGGRLHLAPVAKTIDKALDIGTGTGIWAIDFADEFPNTTVIGTDLSPIQPGLVPPNCRFEIDDVADDWVYPENCFDFIHVRMLMGAIEDWPRLYRQAYKHLKPGGWFEQIEVSIQFKSDDETLKPNSPLHRFIDLITEAGEQTGRSFRISDTMRKKIDQAGFVNVVEKTWKTPMGGWPADRRLRELGLWAYLGFETGLEGYAMALLTRVIGWTTTEVHVFLAQVRAELRDRKIHAYHDIKLVFGQKPEAGASAPAS